MAATGSTHYAPPRSDASPHSTPASNEKLPYPHTSHGATPPAHCYPLGSSIPRFMTPADTDTRHKAHAQHRAPTAPRLQRETPIPPYISRSHSASSLLRSSIPRLLTSQPNAPPPNRAAPKLPYSQTHPHPNSRSNAPTARAPARLPLSSSRRPPPERLCPCSRAAGMNS